MDQTIKEAQNIFKALEQAVIKIKALDQFPVPVWIKGEDFKMIYINDAYIKFTGISRKKYIGKDDYKVHKKEIADIYRENDISTLKRGVLYSYEPFYSESYPTLKFTYLLNDGVRGICGVMLINELFKNQKTLKI